MKRGRIVAKYGDFAQTSREKSQLPPGSRDSRRHADNAALRSLITGRYKIDQYRDLLLGKATGIKNIISLA